jgi:hypothetical protein
VKIKWKSWTHSRVEGSVVSEELESASREDLGEEDAEGVRKQLDFVDGELKGGLSDREKPIEARTCRRMGQPLI